MGAEGEPTCQGGGGGRGGEGGAGDSSRSAPSSCGIGCVGGEQSAITSCDSFFLFLLLDLVSCETSSKARDRAGSNGGGIVARAIEVAAGSAAGVAASAAAGGAVAAAAGVAAAAAAGAAASSAGAAAAGPAERVRLLAAGVILQLLPRCESHNYKLLLHWGGCCSCSAVTGLAPYQAFFLALFVLAPSIPLALTLCASCCGCSCHRAEE